MKTAHEWQKECVYIERVAGKRGLVPAMNNDTDTFIRYCEMQLNAATRDKQHDTATYIQHILEDMRKEQPAKTVICGNWHFWESHGKIMASNEVLKKLYCFDNFGNACNWLAVHNLSIAKQFYKAWR